MRLISAVFLGGFINLNLNFNITWMVELRRNLEAYLYAVLKLPTPGQTLPTHLPRKHTASTVRVKMLVLH